jgi:hypothetical protein
MEEGDGLKRNLKRYFSGVELLRKLTHISGLAQMKYI